MQNIPQPPTQFFVGNLKDIDDEVPMQSLLKLAKEYGSIFKIEILGKQSIFVSSQELVHEICDEKRYQKQLGQGLRSMRDVVKDGLFTAFSDEPNWHTAHNILVPAFGPNAIKNMFPSMYDIAEQLTKKLERFGSDFVIDVSDNMTRLTLDTLALCSFDYRFNSFYQKESHPFVEAMVFVLQEAGRRTRRVTNQIMFLSNKKYASDISFIHGVADEIIKNRKAHPNDSKDLLNIMLNGRDPQSGLGLSDENIRYQLVTFLIAGHETTSGMLSYFFYHILQHPEVLRKAQQEVDEVAGNSPIIVDHIPKLKYIEAALKETLRLNPTAGAFSLHPFEDTTIAGKYRIKKESTISILLYQLHRDPKVWDNPEEFRPERMLQENFAKMPPHSWMPFGFGPRACIGRAFAMQEAVLVVAMILQKFNVRMDNPAYQLKIKETLTNKPDGFFMRASLRHTSNIPSQISTTPQTQPTSPQQAVPKEGQKAVPQEVQKTVAGKPFLVLYASNSGSSEAFAQRIHSDAIARGFSSHLDTLDSHTASLPIDTPVIIVTCSYEGQPASNARHFVSWLDSTSSASNTSLSGVTYTVFGCGHHDWVSTYQEIPRRIDEELAKLGATRIVPRGEADAGGDFFGAFDEWYEKFWPALLKDSPQEPRASESPFSVQIVRGARFSLLNQQALSPGRVVQNILLTKEQATEIGPAKRHIEIELPEGLTYKCGDYLTVLPTNPHDSVRRVLSHFSLDFDTEIVISTSSYSTLPTNRPVSVEEVLKSYVEIALPATRKQVEAIAASSAKEDERKKLISLASDAYEKEVLASRKSVLDLLEEYSSHKIDFGTFLSWLPAMRLRQYSISSSPLWKAGSVTLTIDVLDAPSTTGHGRFKGVGSNFLANTQPNDRISVGINHSTTGFYLPASPEDPIIMICAGTGLAPFRGFIQERAAQKATGRTVGEALLFYGHRDPELDSLYPEELKLWETMGVVQVRHACSRNPQKEGIKYAQHGVWEDRAKIEALFKKGARIYVCGSATKLAKDVKETLIKIIAESRGVGNEEAAALFQKLQHERYSTDVFG